MNLAEIKGRLRAGKYAWPGGYPCFFVTSEGEALSFEAVQANWRSVVQAHISPSWRRSGWFVEACDINWENGELFCAETDERIESAYAESETLD